MQERREHRASRFKKPSLFERLKAKFKQTGDTSTNEKEAPNDSHSVRQRYRPVDMDKEVTTFMDACANTYDKHNIKADTTNIHHIIWIARVWVKSNNIRGKQKDSFMLRVRKEIREVKRLASAA